ncbi:MATH domain and coiled-coil domain-containing protein At3g58360-like [Brassica napus]|uniref:MATH domain and coiled-coil domain-containing protein At3g58360-like n=1 Tax=Brassica napus TaxID=3708 RepID=UPI002079A402|nr:MATH domain and coiled-coil domain-containing protein At3g58360-like [Brassica napus]
MEKEVDKKFTWVIKDFSSLYISAYPKGYKVDNFLSLYLEVPDYGSLPSGWRRHARYRLIVVNQRSEKLSRQLGNISSYCLTAGGFPSVLSLDEINSKDGGFLANGELKIAIEIDLLDIIGKVEVNGFHLLSSQVEYASRMFEKHPDTALEIHLKNPNLRTGYMNLLLSLIDTLRQSPHELPKDDLDEAHYVLESLIDAGFKLDWLEKKISQVSKMKEKAKDGEFRRQEIEEELKDLKQKSSDVEAQLEKEKSEALAAKTPISFDDIIE